MDLWNGTISATDGSVIIKDVQLFSSSPKSKISELAGAKLEFLAFVEPARIPIHIIAGSAFDVLTESQSTLEWFSRLFIDVHEVDNIPNGSADHITPWWERAVGQSDVGMLVRVENSIPPDPSKFGANLTELLIYGTTTRSFSTFASTDTSVQSLPTPQLSSDNHDIVLTVQALPLSSELLYRPNELSSALHKSIVSSQPQTPVSPAFKAQEAQTTAIEAQFLPPLFDDLDGALPPLPTKRKRVDSLFEDAAERRKQSKAKGGVSVSQTMAKVEGGTPQPPSLPRAPSSGLKESRESTPLFRPGSADGNLRASLSRQSLSRSFSAAAANNDHGNSDEAWPMTRKKSLGESKRSSLSRPSVSAGDVSDLESFETKNKNAISRIVMAAMRIYGFQQRKKPERREDSEPPVAYSQNDDTSSKYADEQDEYKLVYHQTFKGACFALRKRMATSLLSQETMRDVVDRLLAIFCTE